MALGNKFLSPTCAPDLGDIDTYFFLKKYFDLISEYVLQWRHFWCSDVTGNPKKYLRINFFSKKIVGVFFTTSRNFLHGGLISFGGAAGANYMCFETHVFLLLALG